MGHILILEIKMHYHLKCSTGNIFSDPNTPT